MNFEYFISKRLSNAKEHKNVLSRPIIRIAVFAIAISVSVMIVAGSILSAFQNEITDRVIAIGSHIQIKSLQKSENNFSSPLNVDDEFLKSLSNNNVNRFDFIINEIGLIKTDDDFLGIQLKGVDYHKYRFNSIHNLLIGSFPEDDNDILVSETISNKINKGVDDKIIVYFPSSDSVLRNRKGIPPVRSFNVCGVFSDTEFDNALSYVDIRKLRKVKQWEINQVELVEVMINDFSNLEDVAYDMSLTVDDHYTKEVSSIKYLYPQIFEWLDLLNGNVYVIDILMYLVAVLNIISITLILILERVKMIGIIKSIGATNLKVIKIFIYNSMTLVLRGLFWGNLFAFLFLLIQSHFAIISLDSQIYYVDHVPVSLDFISIFLVNIKTLFICLIFMILPSLIILKISPIKAIRFE